MKTPQFTTFAALADYARGRAKKSAARNDPIAWAYWRSASEWAGRMHPLAAEDPIKVAGSLMESHRTAVQCEISRRNFREAAHHHSRIKWCAAILRANGKKVKLSLDWMREVQP